MPLDSRTKKRWGYSLFNKIFPNWSEAFRGNEQARQAHGEDHTGLLAWMKGATPKQVDAALQLGQKPGRNRNFLLMLMHGKLRETLTDPDAYRLKALAQDDPNSPYSYERQLKIVFDNHEILRTVISAHNPGTSMVAGHERLVDLHNDILFTIPPDEKTLRDWSGENNDILALRGELDGLFAGSVARMQKLSDKIGEDLERLAEKMPEWTLYQQEQFVGFMRYNSVMTIENHFKQLIDRVNEKFDDPDFRAQLAHVGIDSDDAIDAFKADYIKKLNEQHTAQKKTLRDDLNLKIASLRQSNQAASFLARLRSYQGNRLFERFLELDVPTLDGAMRVETDTANQAQIDQHKLTNLHKIQTSTGTLVTINLSEDKSTATVNIHWRPDEYEFVRRKDIEEMVDAIHAKSIKDYLGYVEKCERDGIKPRSFNDMAYIEFDMSDKENAKLAYEVIKTRGYTDQNMKVTVAGRTPYKPQRGGRTERKIQKSLQRFSQASDSTREEVSSSETMTRTCHQEMEDMRARYSDTAPAAQQPSLGAH